MEQFRYRLKGTSFSGEPFGEECVGARVTIRDGVLRIWGDDDLYPAKAVFVAIVESLETEAFDGLWV